MAVKCRHSVSNRLLQWQLEVAIVALTGCYSGSNRFL